MLSHHGLATPYPVESHMYDPQGSTSTGSAGSASGKAGLYHNASSALQLDILEWHLMYQRCQQYFLDHAQHDPVVQAAAALINISLPFQWMQNLSTGSTGGQLSLASLSLVPYIRRLVVTGMDRGCIMRGFFGDNWREGVGCIHECERRNYLFTAKSVGWAKTKNQYDNSLHEPVPFLKPLQAVQLAEIERAEEAWSHWLAMEDWMIGCRALDVDRIPKISRHEF